MHRSVPAISTPRAVSVPLAGLVLAMVATACTGVEPDGLAMADAAVSSVSTTSQPATTQRPTTEPGRTTEFPARKDATTTTTTAAAAAAGETIVPAGSAAGAPSGGGSAPADLMSLYHGVLGTYSVDQGLAISPVAMPSVAAGVAPLTGLPSARSGTGAIVVKIDNSSKARPQAGLDEADVVIEQEVEGGITRFAAIFQSSAPGRIGPVRSARSTDISFLSALGRPGLAYSGANEVFDTLIVRQERVRNYSAYRFGGYWRDNSRRAPSNLYTSMSQFSTDAMAPPAWFHFAAAPIERGTAVASFQARFPATTISWTWNGSSWQRAQDGRNHKAESGAVLEATNVVVAQVGVVDSGLKDPTGAIVPEFVWAGEGPVAVFTNGRRIDGRWIRPTLGDPAVFVDGSGAIIELMPGTTWVEMTRSLP